MLAKLVGVRGEYGMSESFNGKFRFERLSMEWFSNQVEAKITIET